MREAYRAGRQEDAENRQTKEKYFGRLFIKKIIALVIYVAVMLVFAMTVEYTEIFLTENFLGLFIIWPAVTLAEAIFLDVLFIGHCKKMRLPGTETLSDNMTLS